MTIQHHLTSLAIILGLSGALLAACNDEPLHDLGFTARDLDEATEAPPLPTPPVAEHNSEFAGVWLGEADDPLALVGGADVDPPLYRFPSGSTQIRLELVAVEGSNDVDGTITFGAGETLAPATDANVGYPPDPGFSIASIDATDTSVRPPREGFAFGIYLSGKLRDYATEGLSRADGTLITFYDEGRVVDGKLEVNYNTSDVFGSWCALQTAATCPGNAQLSWDSTGTECTIGDDHISMDCYKAALCASNRCTCPEQGPCRASPLRTSGISLRLSSDGLVGVFGDGVFVNERNYLQPLGTVRFRRAQSSERL